MTRTPPLTTHHSFENASSTDETFAKFKGEVSNRDEKRKDDILYQWRLKRKLEEARREVKMDVGRTQRHIMTRNDDMMLYNNVTFLPHHQHCTCDIIRCQHSDSSNSNGLDSVNGLCNSISTACTKGPQASKEDSLNELVCEVCVLLCFGTS